MPIRPSPLRPLGYFLLAFAATACVDALGTGKPSNRQVTVGDLLTTPTGDSTPGDTTPPPPPPPPPDTTGRAMIRGLVTGIDSTVVPPRFAPIARASVTLFAIVRTPDSSASVNGPPTFDSIGVAVTDLAGRFGFSGLRQRLYALRAVAPAGTGFAPAGTSARAVASEDSTKVPITNLYLHKNSR